MKFNLLISEDSTLVRVNLKRLLKNIDDMELYESRDVSSTITILTDVSIDILLLDLRMPGGSGFDVLKHIGTLTVKPVVVVLTNNSSAESRKKCLASGADYFFDKSSEHNDAIQQVKILIASRLNGKKVENG